MNEECIGYHLVFLTNLKLLINRGNYIFFVTNGLAFQSFIHVYKATHGKVNTSLHLKWHNLKSIHPTIVKLYIFIKLFLQRFQKWHYFCDRGKSENMIADQNVKFGKFIFDQLSIFHPGAILWSMGVNPNKLYIFMGLGLKNTNLALNLMWGIAWWKSNI